MSWKDKLKIEGDPYVWMKPAYVRSLSLGLIGIRSRARRVVYAVDKFCESFAPKLRRTDVVAFIPLKFFKTLKKDIQRLGGRGAVNVNGIQICSARDLTRHVVVFTLADIELGSTPAPPRYKLYETDRKKIKHFKIIREFDGGAK